MKGAGCHIFICIQEDNNTVARLTPGEQKRPEVLEEDLAGACEDTLSTQVLDMLFVDGFLSGTLTRHVGQQNPSGASLASGKSRPCPPAQVLIIHSLIIDIQCHDLAHGELKGAAVLAQAKRLIQVECSHSAKFIFGSEQLRKSARRGYLGSIYFTFNTCKEIELHVPEPVTELSRLRISM